MSIAIHENLSRFELLLSSVSILIVTGANRRWRGTGPSPSSCQGSSNQCCIPSAHGTVLNDSCESVPCLQSPLLEGLSFVIHDEGSAEGTIVRLLTASRKETLGMPSSETERYVSLCQTLYSSGQFSNYNIILSVLPACQI